MSFADIYHDYPCFAVGNILVIFAKPVKFVLHSDGWDEAKRRKES